MPVGFEVTVPDPDNVTESVYFDVGTGVGVGVGFEGGVGVVPANVIVLLSLHGPLAVVVWACTCQVALPSGNAMAGVT